MDGVVKQADGSYVDKNAKGFTLNSKGEVLRDAKVAMKDNPNYKKGYAKAGWDKATDKVKLATDKARGIFDETRDNTPNSGDDKPANEDSQGTSKGDKNKMSHNDSPDLDEESIQKKLQEIKGATSKVD